MNQNFRLPEILRIARAQGKVTVDDLATRFGVTVQTIRRDLGDLDAAGHLERVHGGAILRSGTVNIAYRERRALNSDIKRAIARACAARIPDGASVFLAIGTTTEAVARELLRHRGLLVLTNNLNVANILAGSETAQVLVAGGTLRRADGGLTGPLAVATVNAIKPDIAVVGASAVDAAGDVLDYDLAEVAVTQAVLAQARQGWLVADHSKFQRAAPVRVAGLAALDGVFTDAPLPPALAVLCAQAGTEVVVVGTG